MEEWKVGKINWRSLQTSAIRVCSLVRSGAETSFCLFQHPIRKGKLLYAEDLGGQCKFSHAMEFHSYMYSQVGEMPGLRFTWFRSYPTCIVRFLCFVGYHIHPSATHTIRKFLKEEEKYGIALRWPLSLAFIPSNSHFGLWTNLLALVQKLYFFFLLSPHPKTQTHHTCMHTHRKKKKRRTQQWKKSVLIAGIYSDPE